MLALLLSALLLGNAAAQCGNNPIVAGTAVTGSTETGTTSITTCANTASDSDWYMWVLAAGGYFSISTDHPSTNYDTVVGVFDECYGAAVIGCDDDSGTGLNSLIEGYFSAGTYYIQVGAYSGGTNGAYGLVITALVAPSTIPTDYDGCALATAATGMTLAGTIVAGAATTLGCSSVSGASMWYRWTPTVSANYTLTPSACTWDQVIGVWMGCDTGSWVESEAWCADSTGGTCTPLTFPGFNGVTYYIQVGAYSSTGAGAFSVAVAQGAVIPVTFAAIPVPTPAPEPTVIACMEDADCPAGWACEDDFCEAGAMSLAVAALSLLVQ